VVPVFADQFENGRRIAGAGAAVVAEAGDARSIQEAITSVLAEPSYRRHAACLADEMAETNTVDEALAIVLAGLRRGLD
jgi:UDP:flavonoid glycosyltransferase YjiC (YdhE family)